MVLIMVLSGLLVVFIIVSLYYYHIEDTSDVFSCVKRLTLTFRKGKEKYTEGEAKPFPSSISTIYCLYDVTSQSDVGIKYVIIALSVDDMVFISVVGIIESYVRPSGGNGAYYGIKRIASCVYNC
jgi:hypothetical protein